MSDKTEMEIWMEQKSFWRDVIQALDCNCFNQLCNFSTICVRNFANVAYFTFAGGESTLSKLKGPELVQPCMATTCDSKTKSSIKVGEFTLKHLKLLMGQYQPPVRPWGLWEGMEMKTEREDKSCRGKTPSHVKRDGGACIKISYWEIRPQLQFQFSVSNWD